MYTTLLCNVLALLLLACSVSAVPTGKTPYGKSALRLEVRPDPLWFEKNSITYEDLEKAYGDAGVQARWISITDFDGSPYFRSASLPSILDNLDERIPKYREWIAEIKKQGMVPATWCALSINASAAKLHPEWKQVPIVQDPNSKRPAYECCINTGFGDALIGYCNDAVDKLGIEGFWFDGSAWTQIWEHPVPLTCACADCKRLFKEQTGLQIPTKIDWSDPVFKQWVAWRYETFGAYIKRLAAGIRENHPRVAVAINHYHRPTIPWQSAIPLNPYGADIVYASEATGSEALADLTTRLCRAYEGEQAEVWSGLHNGEDPDTATQTDLNIRHAFACVTAGGLPSFGTGPNRTTVPKTLKHLTSLLNKARPYISPESVPYAAIHVSQQTETFHFSRDQKGVDWYVEPYWQSLLGWTQGLMEAHVAPDYVYDKSFTTDKLRKYKLLLMPMSIALSDEQCKTALAFARAGGTLVLGLASGELDEWGEKRAAKPITNVLEFSFGATPTPAASELDGLRLLNKTGEEVASFAGLHSALELRDEAWKVLYNAEIDGKTVPAVAVRPYGKGKVVVCAVDFPQRGKQMMLLTEGGTTVAKSEDTAASGLGSLKYVDRASAPRVFYPDTEIVFNPFTQPLFVGGRLRCALRVEKGAQARLEVRGEGRQAGPSILAGRDGKLCATNEPLCDIPYDQWFRVDVRFRMAGGNHTWDLTVELPGQAPKTFANLPLSSSKFEAFDTAVIYGEGKEDASFYIDDYILEGITAGSNPKAVLALADDFETNTLFPDLARTPATDLAKTLLGMTPAPVELDAPSYVRMGAFRRGESEYVVHLHNLAARRDDKARGEEMTLRVEGPVGSAALAMSGRELAIAKDGQNTTIAVPAIGIHEVVVVKLDK